MTPQEKQDHEDNISFWENPFAFVQPEICVVAHYWAGLSGLSEDWSGWQLSLSTAGLLVQEIEFWQSPDPNSQPRREERNVGAGFVAQVLRRADELDFWNMVYGGSGLDADTHLLAIRQGRKWRVYDPGEVAWRAHEGDEQALRFLRLWNLIHGLAPFPEF